MNSSLKKRSNRLTKRSNRLTKRINRLSKRINRFSKRSNRSNLSKRSNRLSKRSNRSDRSNRNNRLSKRNNRLSKRSKKILGGEWISVEITETDYEESFMAIAPKTVYYTINIMQEGKSNIIRVRFSDILQLQTTLLDIPNTLSCFEHLINSGYMNNEIMPLINIELPMYQSTFGVKRELTSNELEQRKTHIRGFLNRVGRLLNKFIILSPENDIGENCRKYFESAFDEFLEKGRNQWVSKKKKSTVDWGQAYDNMRKKSVEAQ